MSAILLEPFDIDNGELEGLTLQQAFVLGVEWERETQRMYSPGLVHMVHRKNVERLLRAAVRRGLRFHVVYLDEHWADLEWREPS